MRRKGSSTLLEKGRARAEWRLDRGIVELLATAHVPFGTRKEEEMGPTLCSLGGGGKTGPILKRATLGDRKRQVREQAKKSVTAEDWH